MEPIQLGRYLLTERIALGGTAEIFKAKLVGVEGFEKTVVVKRILPHWSANAGFIAMLVDEAKIMVRLSHERIVQVYELGKEGDAYYIVMEYVHGTDLRRLAERADSRNTPLKPAETCFIIGEVLRGLDYIHQKKDEHGYPLNIVHRDISPQNILISVEGAVKIADFGIAHAASRSYETATGVLKGKFTYMSPEQSRGGALDLRTDLFSTGIILYELLSGRRLFAGGADLEVLERVRNFNVEGTLKHSPIHKALKKVLQKALQPSPKERYSNAHDFLSDLQAAQKELGTHCSAEELTQRLGSLMGAQEGDSITEDKTPVLKKQASKTSPAIAIVSRPLVSGEISDSNTDLEETRSLPEFKEEKIPPTSSLPAFPKKISLSEKWFPRLGFGFGIFLALSSLIYFSFFSKPNKKEQWAPSLKPVAVVPPETKPTPGLMPETQALSPAPPEKSPETVFLKNEMKLKKEEKQKAEREKLLALKKPEAPVLEKPMLPKESPKPELPLPAKGGQGTLAVRALPWGRISISGVVSGVERPIIRSVPFGNYTVSVTSKNLSGEWKTVSRIVRVTKASTLCTAAFRPDGQGSISCN